MDNTYLKVNRLRIIAFKHIYDTTCMCNINIFMNQYQC